jgi:hypothetical protein
MRSVFVGYDNGVVPNNVAGLRRDPHRCIQAHVYPPFARFDIGSQSTNLTMVPTSGPLSLR